MVGSGEYYRAISGEAASCPAGETCAYVDYGLYTESYWGSGVRSVSPQPFSFNASGGWGVDVAGADLILAGGRGTGAAPGGGLIFKTAPASSTPCVGEDPGEERNCPEERMVIDSEGTVGIGTSSPEGNGLHIGYENTGLLPGYLNRGSDILVSETRQDGTNSGVPRAGLFIAEQLKTTGGASTKMFAGLSAFAYQNEGDTQGNTSTIGLVGARYGARIGGTGSVTNAKGVTAGVSVATASSSLTNAFNFYSESIVSGGTVTNAYGLYIEKNTSATNNYGIALAGDEAGADIAFGPTQNVRLYSKSDNKLYAHDGINETQVSPHDPVTNEWIFYSKNVKTGRVLRVNMEELVRDMEKLTGKKYLIETFVKNK